jgi:hypothetical protein
MSNNLMVLPSKDPKKIKIIKMPNDYEEHEVYRHVTGVIANVEELIPDYDWDDILELLEEHGFSEVNFLLGPEL